MNSISSDQLIEHVPPPPLPSPAPLGYAFQELCFFIIHISAITPIPDSPKTIAYTDVNVCFFAKQKVTPWVIYFVEKESTATQC